VNERSDLGIRSEAPRRDIWAQPFLPPPARGGGDDDDMDADFGPLLAGMARALTQLFGLAVTVAADRPAPRGGEAPPRVDPALAALLATLRLGGDPARSPASAGGVVVARQAGAIAAAGDAAAALHWPRECRMAGFDLAVSVAGLAAAPLHVRAPPRPVPPPPVPLAVLAAEIMALPVRVRAELASDTALVAMLLPLRIGSVLPINPRPDMPLLLGDHRIGTATITPLPDGRQQAVITALAVQPGHAATRGDC
jgi:flagellar motor switch/type III secretory pathway protein FliN